MAETGLKETPETAADTPKPPRLKGETKEEYEARMTFTEHLAELRTRIVRVAVAVFIGFVACYAFSNTLMELITLPLQVISDVPDEIVQKKVTTPAEGGGDAGAATAESAGAPAGDGGGAATATAESSGAGGGVAPPVAAEDAEGASTLNIKWVTLSPLEAILVKLKLGAYCGILVTLPYTLFQLCGFIFPGLTRKERRVAYILITGCSGFAVVGAAVAYWLVLPFVLPYLAQMTPAFVETQLQLSTTIGVIAKALVGFALAFQFPMIVLVLVYMGLLTPQMLKTHRKIVIVGMFVVAAVLTPPDPYTMVFMAVPMIGLYEISILVSYIIVRARKTDAPVA